MLIITNEDLLGLAKQLLDYYGSRYRQELIDFPNTVGMPAPTAHPIIEGLIKLHNGEYQIRDAIIPAPDILQRLEALELKVTDVELKVDTVATQAGVILDVKVPG